MADLLAGRQNWAEVIAAARAESNWSPAPAGWTISADRSSAAERLIELLADSSLGADVVVVDVGNDLGRAGQRICRAADALVMVTTSETAAVVGTFAAIKRLVRFDRGYGGSGMAESDCLALPDGEHGSDGLGRRGWCGTASVGRAAGCWASRLSRPIFVRKG